MKRRIEAIILAAVLCVSSAAAYSTDSAEQEEHTGREQDAALITETEQKVTGSVKAGNSETEKETDSAEETKRSDAVDPEPGTIATDSQQEEEIISPEDGQDYVSGNVILVCDGQESFNNSDVQDVLDRYGVTDTEILAGSTGYEGCAMEVTLSDDSQTEAFMNDMESLPQVVSAQRNFVYYLLEDEPVEEQASAETKEDMQLIAEATDIDDPGASYQYHLNSWDETFENACGANLYEAWDLARSEHTVSIAVLDTGCRVSHEDLAANIDLNLAYDVINDLSGEDVYDVQGHGTHVCGIAGAVVNNAVGVAGSSYNARIIPLQVFKESGSSYTCNTSALIEAIDYLDDKIENGELTDLHVVNMSLGGYDSKTKQDLVLEEALGELRNEHQVAIVCAGGNGKKGEPVTDAIWPGDFEECIAVTALTSSGTNAHWSDYNSSKDISAPGSSIYSTSKTDDSSYVYMSGSSMASPLVAGIFALLFAEDPDLTVDEALEAVQSTAHPINQASDYHEESGSAGAIDAAAALLAVRELKAWDLNKDGSVKSSYDEETQTLTIQGDGVVDITAETTVPWEDNREDIRCVVISGAVSGRLEGVFRDMPHLIDVDLSAWDAAGVTDVKDMFANCTSLISLDLGGLNFADVTEADGFLDGCSGLHIICTEKMTLPAACSISLPDTYYIYDNDLSTITETATTVLMSGEKLVPGDAGHDWEMTRAVSASGMYQKECSVCHIKTDSNVLFSDLKGDADQDGKISAADITVINRHVKGLTLITDEQSLLNADADGDGSITNEDCILVARYLARLIDSL